MKNTVCHFFIKHDTQKIEYMVTFNVAYFLRIYHPLFYICVWNTNVLSILSKSAVGAIFGRANLAPQLLPWFASVWPIILKGAENAPTTTAPPVRQYETCLYNCLLVHE